MTVDARLLSEVMLPNLALNLALRRFLVRSLGSGSSAPVPVRNLLRAAIRS